ncbi:MULTISPECIES: hypothetical protein [Curtobacterium]|uniref:hypothetical protein n=1 Tax=Curtobacterium TaxID=2034 RepID=UPI000F874610|nr:hypothetical protein [Curtobacterium sp. HSID17257]RUQ09331.1 hypothetical protein D8M35_02635 [Curtobacterium sp. HSID17257]
MFVDDSRSAQPRPAPRVPVADLLTRSHADPEVEPDLEPEPEPTRTGVIRRDPATATSTFRLRNGAEVTLGGSFGGSRGVWSGAAARPRRQPAR